VTLSVPDHLRSDDARSDLEDRIANLEYWAAREGFIVKRAEVEDR
jgi:hypothetical protein